jgi:hypothetical protein
MGGGSDVHIRIICKVPKATLPPLTVITICESCKRIAMRRASVMSSKERGSDASSPTGDKQNKP